jgi:glycerophosphoryl diester phosphodiesterase
MWERRPTGHPLVLGHRGASALEAENGLAAFERAARDGADGVELDVLCCATGEVLVFHDDDLVRLANRPDRIAELPLAAIREIRLSSGAGIPTLDEALDACGPSLLVNIELKASGALGGPVQGLVDRVAAIVERRAMQARVLVSSFHPMAVRWWMHRAPAVRAALLFEQASWLPSRRAWAARWLRPFALHPEVTLCTAGAVRDWHQRGYMVNAWTADDSVMLLALKDMGVDGIITNDPARARAVLQGR